MDAAQPPTSPRPAAGPRQTFKPQPLIESTGPDPETPVEQVRLAVGLITGTHGIRGELKVRPLTDNPDQFHDLKQVYLGDEPTPRKIRGVRMHARNVLLCLAGVPNAETGAQYAGETLYARAADLRPLQPDELFLYQVIGIEARTEDGRALGRVVDLMETGATDVFVIEDSGSGQQTLLPNLPDVVLEIDPTARVMIVRPMEYLD